MLPPGVLAWGDISNNEAYLGGIVAYTQNAGTVYAKAVLDENPVAPVFVDGAKTVTLKGDHIAEEFQGIVEQYVRDKYPASPSPVRS